MTGTTIATLRELAARFGDDERNLTLYFADLDTPPADDSLNRVFGPPVGLTDAEWPTFPELAELLLHTNSLHHWDPRDARMEHVFTVDLRGVRLLGAPDDAAAMMLFISNAGFHRACRDGNPHTAVRFLREQDLHLGVYQGSLPKRSRYRWSRRFSLVAIDVPGDVFDVPELELPPGDPLVELYHAIADAPARLGGCPIGPREPEPSGWAESSPTLPWSDPTAASDRSRTLAYDPAAVSDRSRTLAYDPAPVSDRSRTLAYDRTPAFDGSRTLAYDRTPVSDRSRTLAYDPAPVSDRSRTLAYDPHRTGADRLLARLADAYTDDDPASVPTVGQRPAPARRPAHPEGPFLMQFQRRFADVHLGQRGVMYVSGCSAYVPSP